MKGMSLLLVGMVLLLGFAGFVCADNETVVGNETVVDVVDNESEEIVEVVEELVVEDLVVYDDVIVEDRESPFDRVISYVGGVVDRIKGVHENLVWVLLVVLVVVLLFVYSVFFNYSSADVCFLKAASLHKKGERAHVSGDYDRAKKLYEASYSFRERGEGMVYGGDDGSSF